MVARWSEHILTLRLPIVVFYCCCIQRVILHRRWQPPQLPPTVAATAAPVGDTPFSVHGLKRGRMVVVGISTARRRKENAIGRESR